MKRGFTLIELLVYMLIMGFIIVVAGRVYSDSTSMRVRTQNMTAATEEMNKVAELIKEDMSQMGAKEHLKEQGTIAGEDEFGIINEVYNLHLDNNDSSSFSLTHRNGLEGGNDTINFRKIVFDGEGNYAGVREVGWGLGTDSILRRSCIIISSPADYDAEEELDCATGTPATVTMATGVRAFSLLPSSPGFPSTAAQQAQEGNFCLPPTLRPFYLINVHECPSDCGDTIKSLTINNLSNPPRLSRFHKNPNPDDATPTHMRSKVFIADDENDCRQYFFRRGETYFAQFQTPIYNDVEDDNGDKDWKNNKIIFFRPGIDHAALGFRTSAGEKIDELPRDFLFYLPQTKNGNLDTLYHYFEFSVPNDVDGVCPVFTFAFYGDRTPDGILQISKFCLGKKDDNAYRFARAGDDDYEPNYATEDDNVNILEHKKNVKAFELTLEIERKGEIGSTRRLSNGDSDDGGGGFVIPTPNNGIRPVER